MNKLTKTLAVILMLMAAALAVLAWWLGNRPAPQAAPARFADHQSATYPSVAAARKLTQGNPIAIGDLKLVVLPTMAPGAYRDIGSVVGEIPLVDIPQDAVITENNLAHGLALKLSPGQRAVAIPVDEVIGAGNKIEAGDYVDVFFTLRRGDEIDKGQARLLASRWQVLAYGSAVVGQMPAGSQSQTQAQPQPQPQPSPQARSAVLAVPVDQVDSLLLAAQNGKLTLALRHPADDGVADAALFSAPQAVLSGKAGLSASQKETLNSADNRAFSGVALPSFSDGVATHPHAAASARTKNDTRSEARPQGSLEVIKGSQRENLHF